MLLEKLLAGSLLLHRAYWMIEIDVDRAGDIANEFIANRRERFEHLLEALGNENKPIDSRAEESKRQGVLCPRRVERMDRGMSEEFGEEGGKEYIGRAVAVHKDCPVLVAETQNPYETQYGVGNVDRDAHRFWQSPSFHEIKPLREAEAPDIYSSAREEPFERIEIMQDAANDAL